MWEKQDDKEIDRYLYSEVKEMLTAVTTNAPTGSTLNFSIGAIGPGAKNYRTNIIQKSMEDKPAAVQLSGMHACMMGCDRCRGRSLMLQTFGGVCRCLRQSCSSAWHHQKFC